MAQHWVEKLFPPTFKYNVRGELFTNDKKLKEISTCYDVKTIEPLEDIYERVRVSYNSDLEARRQKSVQVGDPLKSIAKQKSIISDSGVASDSLKNDPCLWTNSEMKILREAFQTLKEEKLKIVEELKVLKNCLKCKKGETVKCIAELEQQKKDLKCSRDENQRNIIQCKHLGRELKTAQSLEVSLREDIDNLHNQKHQQQKIIEGLRKELAAERRAHKRLSLEFHNVQDKYMLQSKLKEDGIRLEYELQVSGLFKEMGAIQKALDNERGDHVISKRGLDHLRTHFANSVTHKVNTSKLNNFSLY